MVCSPFQVSYGPQTTDDGHFLKMNIAVFWPSWIGDAVMATPAARALRAGFPEAQFVSVLKPYVAGLLEGGPWLAEQIHLDGRGPWSGRWPAVAWQLRQKRI